MIYKNREIPPWLLWFYSAKHIRKLSSELTGQSSYNLQNTIYRRFKKLIINGNKSQETNIITYKCDGTETGTFYLTYNNVNYQFTMPEISEGYILVFNTDTKVLTLNDTTITTETGTSGTKLTFIATPNQDYEQAIKNVTGNVIIKKQNMNIAWNGWAEDFVERIDNTNRAKLEKYDNRNCLFYTANAGYNEYDTKYIFKTNFKDNTAYTFSFDIKTSQERGNICIAYTDGTTLEPNNLNIGSWNKVVLTSNPNKTVKYLRAQYREMSSRIDIDTFMVLEGAYTAETIPDYVPHEEQNYTFTLAKGQFLADDEKLEDNGMYKKYARVDLSTLTWTEYATNKYRTNSLQEKIKPVTSTSVKGNILCEKYIVKSVASDFTDGNIGLSPTGQLLCYDTTGTPTGILQYELLEPTTIPYNSVQASQYEAIKNAKTYPDVTNISATSSELDPLLTIQYYTTEGGENIMRIAKEDLKKKIDERIEDEDLKIELLEDVEDSFDEVVEDTVERVEKTMYDELETKYDELKTKYKERFFKTEDETVTEEKEDETGLAEETVYEKEDIFEETKKEED